MADAIALNLADFHFLRPTWLLALVPLILLLVWLRRRGQSAGAWQAVCDAHLLPYILQDSGLGRSRWVGLALASGGLLAIIALAGPTWERLPQPVFRDQSALAIVLDLSRSMNTRDIKPSRLERARFKIADILKRRTDGQTALVVYAAESYTVVPLTSDAKTIRLQLPALSTDLMPGAGSHPQTGIAKAVALLKQADVRRGDILLITDGITAPHAQAIRQRLNQQPYRLSILGAGTPEGAPIPTAGGNFIKDAGGGIVMSRLPRAELRELAEQSHGIYQSLTNGENDINKLLNYFQRDFNFSAVTETNQQADIWREYGPWLLLPLLPLGALAFRRGLLLVLLAACLPWPRQAAAFDWNDLWSRTDQQAQQAFDQGDNQRAADLFTEPQWQAAAQYRAGNYRQASQSLDGLGSADSLYNRGNALARRGRYRQAVDAYRQSLQLEPDNQDAKYNLKLVQQHLNQGKGQSQRESKQTDKKSKQGRQGQSAQHGQSNQGGRRSKNGRSRPQQAGQKPPEQQGRQTGQDARRDAGNGQANTQSKPAQSPQRTDRARQEKPNRRATAQRQAQAQRGDRQDKPAAKDPQLRAAEGRQREHDQATRQWLRRIPDDPGGLLRRKFRYQYQRRSDHTPDRQAW